MSVKIQNNEVGMVSIMITMIMMLVITLIVIGFAQVTRRNQREALDRQLSTQAYYAAETGVNDAVKYLSTAPIGSLATNTDCTSFITTAGLAAKAKLSNSSQYTCLQVDPNPPELTQAPLSSSASTVWPIKDANGKKFKSLTFAWDKNSAYAGASSCAVPLATFPPVGAWNCKFGVLRVDLVQVDSSAVGTDGAGLAQETVSLFLKPSGGAPSYTLFDFKNNANKSILVSGSCTATTCSSTLNFLATASSFEYYARITMLPYQSSDSVTLTGTTATGPALFTGGQAIIDSTGKSQDELRRIQERVPLTAALNNLPLPQNSLESTGAICKQLTVSTGLYQSLCP